MNYEELSAVYISSKGHLKVSIGTYWVGMSSEIWKINRSNNGGWQRKPVNKNYPDPKNVNNEQQ